MKAFSDEAKAYAREELGMAKDEPNEATGAGTFHDWTFIAEAFDAGHRHAEGRG